MEIGGGRISGIETSVEHPNGTSFGMYQTDQYMAPEGNYDVITAADNSTWYRQYADAAVERVSMELFLSSSIICGPSFWACWGAA